MCKPCTISCTTGSISPSMITWSSPASSLARSQVISASDPATSRHLLAVILDLCSHSLGCTPALGRSPRRGGGRFAGGGCRAAAGLQPALGPVHRSGCSGARPRPCSFPGNAKPLSSETAGSNMKPGQKALTASERLDLTLRPRCMDGSASVRSAARVASWRPAGWPCGAPWRGGLAEIQASPLRR